MTKEALKDGHWVKLAEAANTLQVSEITLRRKVKSGKLSSSMRDGKYYIFLKNAQMQTIVQEKDEKKQGVYTSTLESKELEIQDLKRKVADQQFLIAVLEDELREREAAAS